MAVPRPATLRMKIRRAPDVPQVNAMKSNPLKSLNELLRPKLGYSFRDETLLEQAFRHSSYVNEHPERGLSDNERLEFLGDAVLDLAVSHLLMEYFETAEEGELSKYRAIIVGEGGLFSVAISMGLGSYLQLGKGEEQSGGREKPSLLANAMEALLGALYLDAGFPAALDIIRNLFGPLVQTVQARELTKDFKSLLQEYTQQTHKTLPKYVLTEESGPAHDKRFRIALSINGRNLAEGIGRSKKEAEQQAAKAAFLALQER